MIKTSHCTQCKLNRPVRLFNKDGRTNDGWAAVCNVCKVLEKKKPGVVNNIIPVVSSQVIPSVSTLI